MLDQIRHKGTRLHRCVWPSLLLLFASASSLLGQFTQSGMIKGFEFTDIDPETNEPKYTLTGDARFGSDPNLLELSGVEVAIFDSGQTNLVMNTASALFDQRRKRATTDQKVVAVSDEVRIVGVGMDWDTDSQRLELKEHVEIELLDTGPIVPETGKTPVDDPERSRGEQDPTMIHAQSMVYAMADKAVTLSGGVTVEQGLSRLEAAAMTMTLADEGQQARTIEADGAVTIYREDIVARGGQGFYDVESRTVVLSDHPVVHRGLDRLECDRLEWNAEESRMLASGRPRLILADAGTGTLLPDTQMEGVRPTPEGGTAAEEKPSRGPTAIVSRELSFFPDANRAEFRGDVLVEGPDFQLGADQMDVFLAKSDSDATGEGEAEGSSQLEKVVASGFVELTQPGWRATGDHAEYVADPGRVTLTGDPVARSGKDILSGDVIRVDLDQSVLHCGPNARLWISDTGSSRTALLSATDTAAGVEDVSSGSAEEPAARPIEIRSNALEFRVAENRGRFTGNVRVISADINMNADRMDVLLAMIHAKRVLREVACSGGVKIVQGERWATSERARYDAFEEKVELIERPQLAGTDWALTAKRITFYLNDDQLYAEPSPRLVAYPEEIPDWVRERGAVAGADDGADSEGTETPEPVPGQQPTWTGEEQLRIGEVPAARRY